MYGTPEERADLLSLSHTYFELDWIALGSMEASWDSVQCKVKIINGKLFCEDQNGQITSLPDSQPDLEPVNTRSVFSVDDVEKLALVPELEEIVKHNKFQTALQIINTYGSNVFIIGLLEMPGFQNYNYLGIYDMMTALKLEKDLVHSLVDYTKNNAIRLLRAMSHVGVSGVWLEDSLISGDVISREDYETFFHDANTEIIEEARNCGLYSFYYITGDVMSRIPHIIDMKPDCLAFEESKKNFIADPVEVRKVIGDDVCLLGNIDVYADVQRGDETIWKKAILY